METKAAVLREALEQTRTTQSRLARLSGVKQPSISQMLTGKAPLSDDMLARLLGCMGLNLIVERRAERPDMTRSERRSWALHRRLAESLDGRSLASWTPKIRENLARIRSATRGEPHQGNIDRWQRVIEGQDVRAIRRWMTSVEREAVEMREVSPFGGLLPEEARREVLRELAVL